LPLLPHGTPGAPQLLAVRALESLPRCVPVVNVPVMIEGLHTVGTASGPL
jgi:hypothetical protein